MENGLKDRDIENIIRASRELPEIEEVILFGSRAKGIQKNGSDVDLAIKGRNITDKTTKRLSSKLNEELPLPYFIDIVNYETIRNQALAEHIDRVGKIIYSK
ncbi:MAG: nucleotidyltransferase domain-containing protein [Deltaproteobacteria bacterium]|nr:nucleotidyltransferase domain-containing protein [Deltaproteobacteria bacterium]